MEKEKTLKFEVPIFTRGMIIGKILKNINIKLHLEMKEVNQTNK
jgi:Na+/glutamate symporter